MTKVQTKVMRASWGCLKILIVLGVPADFGETGARPRIISGDLPDGEVLGLTIASHPLSDVIYTGVREGAA